ncbi:MAG: GNAT family N-acetyltransferase [Bacteroidetes bacterium]|nr:GNAT family N-acetyltransferase [Bacteroidota bacterium]
MSNYFFNKNVFSEFPILETDRLILKELSLNDAEDIFEIYSNEEVMKYFGKNTYKDLSEAELMIEMCIRAFKNKEGIRWGIVFKNSGELIGSAGIWRIIEKHLRGEIGYDLKITHWNKGIMTEALRAVTEFGFSKMNLHSLEANIDPDNAASRRLLGKIGFSKEGYFRESYFHEGKFMDSEIYSMLNAGHKQRKD